MSNECIVSFWTVHNEFLLLSANPHLTFQVSQATAHTTPRRSAHPRFISTSLILHLCKAKRTSRLQTTNWTAEIQILRSEIPGSLKANKFRRMRLNPPPFAEARPFRPAKAFFLAARDTILSLPLFPMEITLTSFFILPAAGSCKDLW